MKLTLAYKRRPELVHDTHLFDGVLWSEDIPNELSGKTFADLIFRLSEAIQQYIDVDVFMVRLEQPSVEHPLSSEEVEMIRTHPHKYIDALTIPPQRIVVRVSDEVPVGDVVMTSIPSGMDTLAAAFGDRLYLKLRDGKVESPVTGRWVDSNGDIDVQEHGAWASVSTRELLEKAACPRYFLPRRWNTSGPWITHEDLQKKYDKYIEEKENADR